MDEVRFGLIARALRRRRGWTQERLAQKAGVARSAVGRVERGEAEAFTGQTLRRIAVALGARFEQRLLWHGEGLDRLLDEQHAGLVEAVVSELRRLGWEVVPEATYAVAGERGSIDVLAWHAETGTLLVIEVKSVVPDMQATLAGIDRKARLAPAIARSRAWCPAAVARLLVLPDDRTARRRVEASSATLDAAAPGADGRGAPMAGWSAGAALRDPVPVRWCGKWRSSPGGIVPFSGSCVRVPCNLPGGSQPSSRAANCQGSGDLRQPRGQVKD